MADAARVARERETSFSRRGSRFAKCPNNGTEIFDVNVWARQLQPAAT